MTTGQIFINDRDRLQVDDWELCSGDVLEVLVLDSRDNTPKWIETRVEHDGESYYLTGLLGYRVAGLFARIK